MKQFLTAIALCGLAACAAPPVTVAPSYRDMSQPIGVTSRFDEARFGGLWYVRAGFAPDLGRMALKLMDTPAGLQMRLGAFVCDPAGICGDFAEDLPVRRLGKGRYQIAMPDGEERRFWVLWVDEGFRTAVVGNPEGTFGWILDRATTGGSDRIKAAREILDFNGYDLNNLKVVK